LFFFGAPARDAADKLSAMQSEAIHAVAYRADMFGLYPELIALTHLER
jgi:hypothetical protein